MHPSSAPYLINARAGSACQVTTAGLTSSTGFFCFAHLRATSDRLYDSLSSTCPVRRSTKWLPFSLCNIDLVPRTIHYEW